MADASFFGMTIEGLEDTDQVISAVIVVKMFDEKSPTGVSYLPTATDGLTTVEALGMMEYAGVRLRASMVCDHDG